MKKALLGTDKNVMFIASDVACIISTECREAKKGKKKGEKNTRKNTREKFDKQENQKTGNIMQIRTKATDTCLG